MLGGDPINDKGLDSRPSLRGGPIAETSWATPNVNYGGCCPDCKKFVWQSATRVSHFPGAPRAGH
jgi:hypothetical protein